MLYQSAIEPPLSASQSLILRDFLIKAPVVLESGLKKFFNVPFVQIEASGTAALFIALRTLKLFSPKRKTVIVSAFTCPKISVAVKRAGLRLAICDTGENTFDFDFGKLAKLSGLDTLCIIATHIAGLPADVDEVSNIASSCGAFVIEDAAQAFGAKINGLAAGTAGDIGIFSLGKGKGLSIGRAGVIITRNEILAECIVEQGRQLRQPLCLEQELRDSILLAVDNFSGTELCNPSMQPQSDLPLNTVSQYRKNIASNALERFAAELDRRRTAALVRVEQLRHIAKLSVLMEKDGQEGSWPCLFVTFSDEAVCVRALDRLGSLRSGVSQLFAFSLPEYRHLGYPVPSRCTPNAERFARSSMSISNSALVDDNQFCALCEDLNKLSVNVPANAPLVL